MPPGSGWLLFDVRQAVKWIGTGFRQKNKGVSHDGCHPGGVTCEHREEPSPSLRNEINNGQRLRVQDSCQCLNGFRYVSFLLWFTSMFQLSLIKRNGG